MDRYRPGQPYGIDDRSGFKERLPDMKHELDTGWLTIDPDRAHAPKGIRQREPRKLPFTRPPPPPVFV